jgi:hypothetical protein
LQAFENRKLFPLSFPEEFKKALKSGSGPGGRRLKRVSVSSRTQEDRGGHEKPLGLRGRKKKARFQVARLSPEIQPLSF